MIAKIIARNNLKVGDLMCDVSDTPLKRSVVLGNYAIAMLNGNDLEIITESPMHETEERTTFRPDQIGALKALLA